MPEVQVAKDQSLEQTIEQASKQSVVKVDQTLAANIIDGDKLSATFQVCCYSKDSYLINGRVVLYAVTKKQVGTLEYPVNIFQARIADSRNYTLEPGTCHFPEKIAWPIPAELDSKQLQVIMAVYNDKAQVLGTCCSDPQCIAKTQEE